MARNNLLSLHEAIVVALINQPTRIASFEEIASFIKQRGLFPERKEGISLAEQVMLRSTKSKGRYKHLFEEIGAGYIRLRDSYAEYPLMLSNSLDAILANHRLIYRSNPIKIRVKDEKMGVFRKVELSATTIICITTKGKSGEKKYLYVKEDDLEGNTIVGIYGINGSIEKMRKLFDPIYHYLAPVSDSALVNISFFKLIPNKTLKPLVVFRDIQELSPFKFSSSPAAKEYYRLFQIVQESYQHRISFEKSILAWKSDNPV